LTWRTAILIATFAGVAVWQHFGGEEGLGDLAEVVRGGTPETASSSSFSGRVTRVADGDTFTLSCCRQRVRLWSIDAPEWD
jgi:endonuclease YncB( thermonuclease family)